MVALIDPLYEALEKLIVQSNYLHADESPIKVLDKDKKGQTHRGYFWVYHNSIDGLVWFDYREGRGREGPVEILKDFKGYLQIDGYAVYDIFKDQKILLYCIPWPMHDVCFMRLVIMIKPLLNMLWSK
jgi:transposase